MSFSTSFRNSVGEVDSLQVLRALWRGLAVPDDVLQEAMPELEGRLRYAFSPVAPSATRSNHDELLHSYLYGEVDRSVWDRYKLKLLSLWNSDFESKEKRPFISLERLDGKGFFSVWELLALQAVDRDQVKNGNNLIPRPPKKNVKAKVQTEGTEEGPRWQIWVEVSRLGCIPEQRSARTNVELGVKAAHLLSRWWYMFAQDVTDSARNPHQLGGTSRVPDLRHLYFVGLVPLRRGSLAFTVVLASGRDIPTQMIEVYSTTNAHPPRQNEDTSCDLLRRNTIICPPVHRQCSDPPTGLHNFSSELRRGDPSYHADAVRRDSGIHAAPADPSTSKIDDNGLSLSTPLTRRRAWNEQVNHNVGQSMNTKSYLHGSFISAIPPRKYMVNPATALQHDQTLPSPSSNRHCDGGQSYEQSHSSMQRLSATRSTIFADQTQPISQDDRAYMPPSSQTDFDHSNNTRSLFAKSRRASPRLPGPIRPQHYRRARKDFWRSGDILNTPSNSLVTLTGVSMLPRAHDALEYSRTPTNTALSSRSPRIPSQPLLDMPASEDSPMQSSRGHTGRLHQPMPLGVSSQTSVNLFTSLDVGPSSSAAPPTAFSYPQYDPVGLPFARIRTLPSQYSLYHDKSAVETWSYDASQSIGNARYSEEGDIQ